MFYIKFVLVFSFRFGLFIILIGWGFVLSFLFGFRCFVFGFLVGSVLSFVSRSRVFLFRWSRVEVGKFGLVVGFIFRV